LSAYKDLFDVGSGVFFANMGWVPNHLSFCFGLCCIYCVHFSSPNICMCITP
jgi:hypothetical protein